MTQNLPFSGLRVVALEQAVSAPFCSRQLADMGADVIKVERPDGGDFARNYDGALNGLSAYFAWLNRGKRSIVLDIKKDDDLATLKKLVLHADIFIHNLAPGAVERYGFGYEPLHVDNPRLIWCGVSGYGPDGPYRDKKAYDLLIQAESGVVSLTGSPDEPAKVGISIADIAAGLYAYSSIQTALFQRERTGQGERIDISMLECLTEWMMPPIHIWQGTDNILPRAGVRHNMIMPYGVFPCRDGAVNLAIQNNREWARFCTYVLRQPELIDDSRFTSNARRVANRQELEILIEAKISQLSTAEVLERLVKAEIAHGAVNNVADVAQHPQHKARDRWAETPTPFGNILSFIPPHNLQSLAPHMGAVPALGEHTAEILAELNAMED